MEKIEKVDRDFCKCHICETVFHGVEGDTLLSCPNGCVRYNIDPQGENVKITLFNDEEYFVRLYDDTRYRNKGFRERIEEYERNYIDVLNYWREDDKYLIRLIAKE